MIVLSTYTVHTLQVGQVKRVQLMRPTAATHSSATHSWDTQQRLVDVPFGVHGVRDFRVQILGEPNPRGRPAGGC